MDIRNYELGLLQTNCYVVGNDDKLVIIDPGGCPPSFMQTLQEDGRIPEAILLTHGHFDHILGVDELTAHFDLPVYALEQEAETFNDPAFNLGQAFIGQTVQLRSKITYFSEGEKLDLAGLTFETIWIPGHSYGGCCYYLRDEHVLFSGDALFYGSIGRTDGPQGDMRALVDNLKEKVLILPDETEVYPGHGPATSIGFEKQYNPFIRW